MICNESYEKIKIGQKASITKMITEEDVLMFSEISQDINPLHMDKNFAKQSMFKKRIVHGFLVASLISAVLGTKLPGANTIYLSQDLQFLAPAFIGDILTATVTVLEKKDHKNIIILETIVTNKAQKVILKGKAVVKKID
ncbi:MaoC family dehydratase [Inediibacterium massiliense]|uniref:MaoC family dehydratase n=1 Tax=Inediibacterium massiliense TaxID=1658111 RepID=UPI0006B5BA47|nr:MaoC family dehydratase [Inediibacterium massiliense]